MRILSMAAGLLLDALLGDPPRPPHPVVIMGREISFLEGRLRKQDGSPRTQIAAGAVLTAAICIPAFLVPFLTLMIAGRISIYISAAVSAVMCYQAVAVRSLYTESMRVYHALKKGGLAEAREAVGRIVGRDTAELSEEGVIRAAVETVAENTSDGVTAPLMYFAAGGGSLAFFYKAVNTLDSMIGYKNEKYLYFCRFAARLDDVMNFLPSRLTALIMVAAAALCGLDMRGAWRIWHRDRRNHKSPNSAQTEAAAAGALGIRLGGSSRYFGEWVQKPYIGDDTRPPEAEDIRRANRLMISTSLITAAVLAAAAAVCGRII